MPYMDFNLLVLTSFEVTTTTTMDPQEPACCYNSHLLAWRFNEVGANMQQLSYKVLKAPNSMEDGTMDGCMVV